MDFDTLVKERFNGDENKALIALGLEGYHNRSKYTGLSFEEYEVMVKSLTDKQFRKLRDVYDKEKQRYEPQRLEKLERIKFKAARLNIPDEDFSAVMESDEDPFRKNLKHNIRLLLVLGVAAFIIEVLLRITNILPDTNGVLFVGISVVYSVRIGDSIFKSKLLNSVRDDYRRFKNELQDVWLPEIEDL